MLDFAEFILSSTEQKARSVIESLRQEVYRKYPTAESCMNRLSDAGMQMVENGTDPREIILGAHFAKTFGNPEYWEARMMINPDFKYWLWTYVAFPNEMDLFDELPPAIRSMMNDGITSPDARQVYGTLLYMIDSGMQNYEAVNRLREMVKEFQDKFATRVRERQNDPKYISSRSGGIQVNPAPEMASR